jgi:signal transduction histidine kinase
MPIDQDGSDRLLMIVAVDRAYADSLAPVLAGSGFVSKIVEPTEARSQIGDFAGGLILCDVDNGNDTASTLPMHIAKTRPDLTCIPMANRPNKRDSSNPLKDDTHAFIDKRRDLDAALAIVQRCFEIRGSRRAVREAEVALENARQALADTNRSKLQFIANMSHELRTPLNAVIGFSEIVLQDMNRNIVKEQHKSYIEDIHSAGRHLLGIINDILDFAKAESGTLTLQEREVDVCAVVAASVRLVGAKAREMGIEINNRVPDDLPRLWGDELKVKQMLLNVLSNAVKFTKPKGHVDITGAVDLEGLVLNIRDTGIGISETDLPRVMQPFVQVENSRTRLQEGTGIGLPLVKAMVELHGGNIALQSVLDEGTTVRLTFPAARVLPPRDNDDIPALKTAGGAR